MLAASRGVCACVASLSFISFDLVNLEFELYLSTASANEMRLVLLFSHEGYWYRINGRVTIWLDQGQFIICADICQSAVCDLACSNLKEIAALCFSRLNCYNFC